MVDYQILRQKCEQAFAFAEKQLHYLVESYPDYFPIYTSHGKWKHAGEAWTNWCEGFLGGLLWLVYLHHAETLWRDKAEYYCRLIEPRKNDRSVHDLGFLFWPTWKRWFDLTDDPAIQAVVIEAGRTLALRFKEKGQYLSSFVAENSLFIDIMMNVGIIFYAAKQTQDVKLYRIANQHCLTTRRYLVRGDGSTAHEGLFDTETGAFIRQSTQQGWRSDSSWARGLTWAIYGFVTAYEYTRDARFLQTAESCANYYIENTPDHGVCPNDWSEPTPLLPYDSSAAAVAASGMLNLAINTGDAGRAPLYRRYAYQIMDTLTGEDFLAINTPGWEGILKHGIYHASKGLGIDESVMWGDYYFLEAAYKVLHHDQ